MLDSTATQRIVKVRRDYNAWVADETMEDYALRFTPRSFRKWSALRVANTAIGATSFLALEAVGASMALNYGFQTAVAAILAVGLVIFLTGLPISYYCARFGVDMDLLTRGAGFGYVGSTATSLIYACFTFLFFALEAAIMAQALKLAFGLPLGLGYIVCAVAVIPLVTYGVTLISRLQMWTQPIWIVLLATPYACVLWKDPGLVHEFVSFAGRHGNGHSIDWMALGSASTVAFSLIAQIGEQVDFLRFLPERTAANRRHWWAATLSAGPGWIIPGALKLLGGAFLAFLALQHEVDITRAVEPTQMYLTAYGYVLKDPRWIMMVTVLFVIVSQVKINVTNAYAGSLAWSNFFARLTHSHPGRVVWLVFNVLIAVTLMELGVFDALEDVLGFYSNVAIAWIGAVVADLVINKPLGLSPPHIEFKRAHLYDVNPVGVGALIIASAAGTSAYAGLWGAWLQAYSPFLTLAVSFVCVPLIAWGTGSRYYLARQSPAVAVAEGAHTQRCVICENPFEGEDMAHCAVYAGPICSLCCTLDVRCQDRCKDDARIAEQVTGAVRRLLPERLSARVNSRLGHYLVTLVPTCLALAVGLFALYYLEVQRLRDFGPRLSHEFLSSYLHLYIELALAAAVGTWWLVLANESRHLAFEESSRQTQLLMQEIEAHRRTDAELERARRDAEAANAAKSRFVTGMSHELRTPLNSIIGYAQILRKERQLPPHRQEAVGIIQRSGEHLLSLIDGMLDIARIESGRLRLERNELRLLDFLEQIMRMFELQAQDRGLSLELELGSRLAPVVYADTKRLRQVLINLIGNAVKFTHQGGVKLRVSYLREMASFEISDTGIGIPPDDLERIFLPFERGANGGPHAEPGTGLGLTITKLLTEVMGGQIDVSSTVGEGSRFIVRVYLPAVDRPAHAGHAEQDIVGYMGERRTLLVVDDQASQRQLLTHLLEGLGFSIVEAGSGPETLASLVTGPPVHGILLDVAMPGIDGWATARLIRNRESGRIPIIMVSANAFDNTAAKLRAADCDDFIVKPTLEAELLAKLQQHLGLKWVFQQDRPPEQEVRPFAARGPRPPADALRSLRALAEVGYVKGLLQRLDEIETGDGQLAAFCSEARRRVRSFRLKELIQLLGKDEHVN